AEPTGTAIFLTWPSFRSAILVMHWRLLWRSCSDIRSATISVREPINLDEGGIGQVEMLDQVSMAFLAPLHRLHSDAVAVSYSDSPNASACSSGRKASISSIARNTARRWRISPRRRRSGASPHIITTARPALVRRDSFSSHCDWGSKLDLYENHRALQIKSLADQ